MDGALLLSGTTVPPGGCEIKESGNILVRCFSSSPLYIVENHGPKTLQIGDNKQSLMKALVTLENVDA